MRRVLAFVALAAGLAALAPAPEAAAQSVTICVANQAGAVLRSKPTYADLRGRVHATEWDATALGQRSCHTLRDIGWLRISVQAHAFGWHDLCEHSFGGAEAARTRTLFVTGSMLNFSCQAEG